ncbi:MAG TPA: XRE family transcriptional regulator [Polyangia bacterium]|nr:XRE family transcriptional regulator [Polyangia bacterium]
MSTPRSSDMGARVGDNIRDLRLGRGLSQQQMAKLSGLPRATWQHLESGGANPTLSVLHKVALALQVSVEELISPPRAACRFYAAGSLPQKTRGQVHISRLLPDAIPGVSLERLELPPRAAMSGIPHTDGTREYLTCESGEIQLSVAGESWTLKAGDVVVFRGDQKHGYANPGGKTAIGYSVVLLASGT